MFPYATISSFFEENGDFPENLIDNETLDSLSTEDLDRVAYALRNI